MNQKIIFISWTPFGRHTELLGKSLNAEIFYISKFIKFKGILWKLLFPVDYILKSIKSLKILLSTKPSVVFVQNPPSIAPVVIVFFSKFLKFKTVIDSHNGAFEKPWVNTPFHIWALRNATIITIHNSILFNRLTSDKKFSNINFKILNSKLSEYPSGLKDKSQEKYFLIISSFSGDEPMDILLQGLVLFSKTNNNWKFKITGNYKREIDLYNKYSENENIEFLGFVDDKTYDYLLVNAYGIIALSTRDDVQQFALMEAVGAGVPFISNKNKTNIDLFEDKMILIENDSDKISEGITDFINNKNELNKNIIDIKIKQEVKWEKEFDNLLHQLKVII